jgi:hypothetical protein
LVEAGLEDAVEATGDVAFEAAPEFAGERRAVERRAMIVARRSMEWVVLVRRRAQRCSCPLAGKLPQRPRYRLTGAANAPIPDEHARKQDGGILNARKQDAPPPQSFFSPRCVKPPVEATCACGAVFAPKTVLQVRCLECQAERRRTRKR